MSETPPVRETRTFDVDDTFDQVIRLSANLVQNLLDNGIDPIDALPALILSAATLARAADLDEADFLEGCRAAFTSVEVSRHAVQ